MGLKQGDNLSPLEFNVFLDDVREIFDKKCDPLERFQVLSRVCYLVY